MQHNLAYVDYHQLHPPSNHQGNRPHQSLGCHFAYFDAQWVPKNILLQDYRISIGFLVNNTQ